MPIIPVAERLEIVRSIDFVDEAVIESKPEKLDTWRDVRFDILFKGDDWKGTAKGNKLERDFRPYGVEIVYLPYTMHTSSTILRGALERLLADAS
jgi:glycerol-3-phosphate cytidylyltransferase